MVFSPINTALLLILLWPSGDGYSLLCSSKSSFRGTSTVYDFALDPSEFFIICSAGRRTFGLYYEN
jgi:hypothetical protein